MHNTGLGSITAEYLGGMLARTTRSEPLEARELAVEHKILYYKTLGEINTKEVITNPEMKTRINLACSKALKSITNASIEQLFRLGKEFAKDTGLLEDPELIQLIQQVEAQQGSATMNMIGRSIIATKPFPGSTPIQIAKQGATLLT
jgi:pantoate kinase